MVNHGVTSGLSQRIIIAVRNCHSDQSSHNYTPAARMKLPVDPPSRAGQRFHVASARAANTDWSAAVLAYSNFYAEDFRKLSARIEDADAGGV
ncbi:hypothetical protein J6590_100287 [Homalodisca vitripennis]|nr:hypothetical protein J6590_100287 [Homalodisca vitripennis]